MTAIPALPPDEHADAGGNGTSPASHDGPHRPRLVRSGDRPRLIYRLLLAVDIQGYSARTPLLQLQAQTDLRDVLERAAADTSLDRRLWFQQVSGDGELDVLPDDADIAHVVGCFATAMERALADLNRTAAPERRLRVRLALHYGTLILGEPASFGPAGNAPVVVSRLLDARPLRRALVARADRDLALIVSDRLFEDIVRSGLCALPPEDFQAIRTTVKGVLYQGHVYDPAPRAKGLLNDEGACAELSEGAAGTRADHREQLSPVGAPEDDDRARTVL
ncbi:hypothetical protein [Actinomadura yumaensis]|uniref:Guanylate cyclase domain-containing protein n=1 Tax=Actinomadura yumaensis TaxID=111807 RepID=A0ABW2CH22_9ACTN